MRKAGFISIELLLFLVLAAFVALLLAPAQRRLDEAAARARDSWAAKAEVLTGKTLRYESARLSFLAVIDVRGITLSGGGPDAALPDITIERLRAPFSLGGLLRGRGAGAIRNVMLEKPSVIWRVGGDAPAAARAEAREGARRYADYYALAGPYLPEGFTLGVRRGNVTVSGPRGDYAAASGVRLDIEKRGALSVSGRWRTAARVTRPGASALNLSAHVRVRGFFTPEEGSLRVGARGVDCELFALGRTEILARFCGSEITVRKVGDRRPFDLSCAYDLDTREYSAAFRAERFTPASMLSLKGDLGGLSWLPRASVGGAAALKGRGGFPGALAGADITYTADLAGEIPASSPVGAGGYVVRGEGDGRRAVLRDVALRINGGSVGYKGSLVFKPLIPNGTLDIRDLKLRRGAEKAVRSTFLISGYGDTINLFADSLFLGDLELQGVNADLFRTASGYDWALSALRFMPGEAGAGGVANIEAGGGIDLAEKRLEASVALDSFALSDILDALALTADTGAAAKSAAARSVFFTTEIFVSADERHFSYNIPHFVTAFRGKKGGFAVSSFSGSDQFFEMSASRLVFGARTLDMAARAEFADKNDVSFNLDLSLKNIAYYFNGSLLDRRDLHVSGSYGFELAASFDANGTAGFVKTDYFPVPAGAVPATLSLDSDFRFAGPERWRVSLNTLRLSGGGAGFMADSLLRAAGTLDQDGARFPDLYFSKSDGALYGDALFDWKLTRPGRFLSGRLSLNNNELSERFVIDCRAENGEAAFRADALNFRSDWIYGGGVNATLSGAFAVTWRGARDWDASFDIYSLAANLPSGPAQIKTRGSVDHERLLAGQTSLVIGGIQASLPYLDVSLRDRTARTRVEAGGFLAGRGTRFAADLRVEFSRADDWPAFFAVPESARGEAAFAEFSFGDIAAREPFLFAFEKSGAVFDARGGPRDMLKTRMDDDGNLFLSLSAPSPVRGLVFGSIRDKNIDIESSGLYVDLKSVWEFAPVSVVEFTDGIVSADIRIRGPLADPSFYGSANGTSVALRIPGYVDGAVGPAPATLTFTGGDMILEPLTAPVGSGRARLSGVFQFDRWVPATFALDIEAGADAPVPFAVDVAGISASGLASGRLGIVLDENSVSVRGDLTGDNAEITLDSAKFSFQFRPPEKQNEDSALEVVTDLKIRTGRKVGFLWPNKDLPILQATATAASEIAVASNSLAGTFSLKGNIGLRSGEMYYFQRSFYLRSGSLTFNENENIFDPRLSVRAEMRDRTADGPVTISMIIDNQSLLSFSPRLESSPALSQAEILSIMGENLSGSANENDQIERAFVSSTVDILSQFILVRRFENFVRDRVLHVDMFSARTQFLQNMLLLNTTAARDGAPSSIGNYFDNTALFIGKYVGSDMFGQLMINMRYDENRAVYQGLSLEPEFNIELNTPLFIIQWQITLDHFENLWTQPGMIKNLWIPNNSISLVKHWSLP